MRAVWLSYVELNRLLAADTVEAVQAALDEVMDNCVSYGVNTLVFHVRANSDAYYASALFPPAAAAKPWLDAGFDPLAYAVQAAHGRGSCMPGSIPTVWEPKRRISAATMCFPKWSGTPRCGIMSRRPRRCRS